MDYSFSRLEDGGVFTITREAKRNALTRAVWEGLTQALDRLEAEGGRFLVITGGGDKAFCAGTDLAEAAGLGRDENAAKNARVRALLLRLSRSPVFSVAAVNGLAFGGGLEVAMGCAVRIAAPHATFSMPEVKLGVLPAYGGTQFLPAIIGRPRALDMMLTGRVVDAHEALAMGLINREAFADAPLLDQAIAYAREVTAFSPVAIANIRHAVEASGATVTEEGLAAEAHWVNETGLSADAREGVAAFLEKRKPVWTGR
ncbi:enoyl-CoA hydratase/isomerase family protein [Zavarzinia sp. CC-PAN008]|uniref:enoyl-CoA hydratase/isomerase family protein n=1 Tax=Zavarzinia sp. CC-PAN008 TaxID=3243332 RepID=UPI003F749E96